MITDLQMIIIVILTAVVAAGLGMLWGVSRYTHIYDWFSASFFSRMQKAMKGLGYSQSAIDNLLDKMGQRVMLNIPPPPTPPVKDGPEQPVCEVVLEDPCVSFDWTPAIPEKDFPIMKALCVGYSDIIRKAFDSGDFDTICRIEEVMAKKLELMSDHNYGIRVPRVSIKTYGPDKFIRVSFDRL